VEVVGEAGAVRLGGPRQRAVLTILLLDANRVVPVERIADDLYGDDPPPTAVAQVRDHVSQLRRVLGRPGADGGEAMIEPGARGYPRGVDRDAFDGFGLGRTGGEAGVPRERGDAGSAAAPAGGALGLGGGPPRAEFGDEPFARAAIARLESLRLRVVEG